MCAQEPCGSCFSTKKELYKEPGRDSPLNDGKGGAGSPLKAGADKCHNALAVEQKLNETSLVADAAVVTVSSQATNFSPKVELRMKIETMEIPAFNQPLIGNVYPVGGGYG